MADDPFAPEDESQSGEGDVRDPNVADMFGAPPEPAAIPVKSNDSSNAYQVLARKYRPRTFEDLIGQEAMVKTLGNAFALGRIAHAFMLTGVRGVGKTTTARLLARALNFDSETQHGPSIDLTTEGRHCRAIIEGRHMDVLEMDAASRTKVDEMRELLDSVRYAPVEARYKVYVIDEVHMLSTAAFNALLKTLEEPPPHAKFIFATTEIRKVPVTILSRCQRFDLRRVEPEILGPHLTRICEREGVRIDPEGIALIAKAAEGSVRDGLSLLDQALVQADGGQEVAADSIREMLGLADRAATIGLFESVMGGRVAESLEAFRTLYGYGADPAQLAGDLLEHCHGASIAKALGPAATRLPNDQAARLAALGASLSAGTLSRVWSMLLKAYEDVRRAPDPCAALEMALIRIAFAADLPGPEEALKRLALGQPLSGAPSGPSGGGGGGSGGGANAMLATAQAPAQLPMPQSFDEVVALIGARRDIGLKMDVERFVRLVSFKPRAIEFEPAPGAPGDLARKLSARLREWTGQAWMVAAQGGGGAESFYERERRERDLLQKEILDDPFVKVILGRFPGAEVLNARRIPAPVGALPESGESADDDDEA